MIYRLIVVLILISFAFSCDDLSTQKSSDMNRALLDTVIDYNDVDVYPLFLDCNNCDTSEKQNLCFEMELVRQLKKLTIESGLDSSQNIRDTVMLDILVSTEGKISILNIHKSQEINELLPDLDSLLYKSVASLPSVVQPSLKRGIPVNTQFKLPIVLQTLP